ncbi:MAG: alpha/beta fold hydrolase [Actinobacteria bacterium]|nr:alpha/beta fold hydrolase [Actinomycetota bacterium]
MHDIIESNGLRLAAHLSEPTARAALSARPGLVLCHGFPVGLGHAENAARTYPELADRIAGETGWTVLTFNFRGTGTSEGDFSLQGWLDDLNAAIDHLLGAAGADEVWLAGSSTGGSLAVCAGANDQRVRGVAALSARADFDDWVEHPRRFLEHARDVGVIRHAGFPPNVDQWVRELKQIRPIDLVERLAPRPLLLVQGSDDEIVPPSDARLLADYHGSAELHMISGAGHRLRHDPRAVAVLLGWIERQSPVHERTPESAVVEPLVDDPSQ